MAYYVGVDLGATNVRAVVADGEATILGRSRERTPDGPTGIAVTETVLSAIRGACEDAGVAPGEISAAGIGSFGPLDLTEGTVENPANLPEAIDRIPLTGPVANLVGTDRVHLHNDTNAGVIGQRYFSERNPDDMVYLTMSSGIGAGVCVDGHVLRGWDGNAGEVGHMTVDPEGRMTCGCGHDGHWEAYCSGNNVPRYARLVHETEGVPTDLPLDDPDFDAAAVFAAVDEDPLAERVIHRFSDWNTMGVANLCHAFAPLVVYVGGAVALNNPDLVLDPIRERLGDQVMVNVPDVELTTLGDDVVVLGALASALTDGTGDGRAGR
ncbi:ROK family protein [Halomarina pelagica]|uniref:ROK family protein n=1 Tax=Halomarina pelagica TaxID=2961599 RepID=UPI0020C229B9|nr:ROK family protein [Halomarina sp. BND7]